MGPYLFKLPQRGSKVSLEILYLSLAESSRLLTHTGQHDIFSLKGCGYVGSRSISRAGSKMMHVSALWMSGWTLATGVMFVTHQTQHLMLLDSDTGQTNGLAQFL